MRTYYRARDAVVTSEHFIRRGPSARSFAIRDLHDARIVRDPGNSRYRLACTTTGVLSLAAAAVAWLAGNLYAVSVFVLAVAVAVVASMLWRRRPARWNLRADYRGEPVTLFTSCDSTAFHQVARALRRALEEAHRPVAREEDAA